MELGTRPCNKRNYDAKLNTKRPVSRGERYIVESKNSPGKYISSLGGEKGLDWTGMATGWGIHFQKHQQQHPLRFEPSTFNARMNSNQPKWGIRRKKGAGEGTGGHGSGPGPTGNRMGTRTIAGMPAASPEGSFNNKSHDRHGNTEMLFLGLPLPSHGNGPRPPCERKVRIKKLAYTQYPLSSTL